MLQKSVADFVQARRTEILDAHQLRFRALIAWHPSAPYREGCECSRFRVC